MASPLSCVIITRCEISLTVKPMTEFITGVVTHTPVWVWVLFVFLITRGIKARKPAIVTLEKLAIIPAIFSFLGYLRSGGVPQTHRRQQRPVDRRFAGRRSAGLFAHQTDGGNARGTSAQSVPAGRRLGAATDDAGVWREIRARGDDCRFPRHAAAARNERICDYLRRRFCGRVCRKILPAMCACISSLHSST